jgi:hypothetical protein
MWKKKDLVVFKYGSVYSGLKLCINSIKMLEMMFFFLTFDSKL